MLTRNIDVSVGSTVGLCAIAVGVALKKRLWVGDGYRLRAGDWRAGRSF